VAGRVVENPALAGSQAFAEVKVGDKVGGGLSAAELGPAFDDGLQAVDRDLFVAGDRRHGEHHSGAERRRHELEGAEPGPRPIQPSALIGLEAAVPGGNAHPLVAQVGC